ncbi:MAG: RNA polymerase factor sigma-54 [Oscillospiraceae bacterium]|nr:RNA polymerase factor sigma-54 [Oscillospiraceae bacterium]
MELTLEQKQVQKLSAQMVQSMEILQMGTQELEEYAENLLLENPALERSEPTEAPVEARELFSKLEWLAANDRQNRSYRREENTADWIDVVADSTGETLYEHLSIQVDWNRLSPALQQGVEGVLTGLDGNGYLEESTEELARRCGLAPDVMARAEELVRALEPAGVGARNLGHCLALQLERLGETGLPLTIVNNYLEDMAKNHFHRIATLTGAGRAEIQQACELIRSLQPRPGAAFVGDEHPQYIAPDLLVSEEMGELTVCFADQRVPELKVSSYYRELMRSSDEEQVRNYLAQKVQQADWVIRSIEQRKSTVLACAESIVARQEPFFRSPGGVLRPMTLADVASDVGVHESTVSRAVKDKYLQCARGLFPLSHFFSRALSSTREDLTAAQAKDAIRTLIAAEDPAKPASDQKLSELLSEQGIRISRRTVAKYREELGVPSAAGRKKF